MSNINAIKNEFNLSVGLFGKLDKGAVDQLVKAFAEERGAHQKTSDDLREPLNSTACASQA